MVAPCKSPGAGPVPVNGEGLVESGIAATDISWSDRCWLEKEEDFK